MILWILPNFTRMWGISDKLQYTFIGVALLIGAIVDEMLRQRQKIGAYLLAILSILRRFG
jgi:hypothetical protein